MVMTDRRGDLSGRLLTMQDRAQPEPHGPFDVVVPADSFAYAEGAHWQE